MKDGLSLVHSKVKRLILFPALPKSTSKEDICSLHLMTHGPQALRNLIKTQFQFCQEGYLLWLISSGICRYNLRSVVQCTSCGQRNEVGWHQPCVISLLRAGPELYLDPVYIFQGT